MGLPWISCWLTPRDITPSPGSALGPPGAEKVVYADSRAAGALFTAAAIAPALAGGIVVEKAASRRGWLQVAATAAATWAALGVRRLANEGGIMADRLDSGDLEAAREQLPNLCGRDPRTLDEEGLWPPCVRRPTR